jgi:hypothetical protein
VPLSVFLKPANNLWALMAQTWQYATRTHFLEEIISLAKKMVLSFLGFFF